MTSITVKPFAVLEDGRTAELYTLKNASGMEVSVTNFGGAIVSLLAPDRDGKFADVVLGHPGYEGYRARRHFFGALVGRCCNRIKKGRFTINGETCQLAINDRGKNHLHGGVEGFDQKLWDAKIVERDGHQTLRLTYTSPDGEEHYPGTLSVSAEYLLTDSNALELRYSAVCDADTVCNLTNHSYFNLAGHDSGTVLNHQLKLYADYFTEADSESIPTGRILPVADTPMDFREFHRVGERIEADYQPLHFGGGYDHNWVLRKGNGVMGLCAELYEETSGRHMICETTLPCVQFYSGNGLDGTIAGKGGCCYQKHSGLCLETQFAPDSVNHPEWDNPVLKAGQRYESATVYRFDVK